LAWFVTYFKRVWLRVLLGTCLSPVAIAQTVFTLFPDTCVTLQQGRHCYAQIQINWQREQTDSVCLYREEQPLKCWDASTRGEWQWAFSDTRTQVLTLRRMQADGRPAEILATEKVEVSWVQDTHKKRVWRRF